MMFNTFGAVYQGWPTCLPLGSTRNFLTNLWSTGRK